MPVFTKKKPTSPAEQRLADAQKAKDEAQAEVDVASAVLSRLEAAARAAGPISAEIAMLDRDESAAMAQWAADANAGAAPTPDHERRVDLQRRLAAAEAQARAAAGAMAAPRAAVQAASQRLGAAHRAAWIAGKLIQIEQAHETLAPLRAAIAKIYECKRRVDEVRWALLADLRHGDNDTHEVLIALEGFDRRRQEAEAVPMAELKPPYDDAPAAQHELARAMAALGPVGNNWDVGAPSQASASPKVGLFAR
jgi:hypothetical protein